MLFHTNTARALRTASLLSMLACVNTLQAQTLDAVIRHALNEYPGIKAAAFGVIGSQAEIDRSKGAYSPTLSLNASANKIQDLNSAEQKPMASPWLAWSVPINGRVTADVQRSESAARAAKAKLQVTRDDVALQVSDAWLSVVRSEQMVLLAQNNVAEHDVILGDVRKMVAIDAGRAGTLTFDAAATYLLSFDRRVDPRSVLQELAGTDVQPQLALQSLPLLPCLAR